MMDHEERTRDRVRVLLVRYGVVFRELLFREVAHFQWTQVFRSLRLMELSGEIVSGYFFEGIPGPQFATPQALALFRRIQDARGAFWLNACDPASVCGLPLDGVRGTVPSRIESTHCVYRGPSLVCVSRRQGTELTINLPVGHEDLPACFAPLKNQLSRRFRPVSRVTIETINNVAARESDYLGALRQEFDVNVGHRDVTLNRKTSGS